MRCLPALLAVGLLLPAFGAPPGAAAEGAAVAWPREGDVMHYRTVNTDPEGKVQAFESVSRMVGTEDVLDRDGRSRTVAVFEIAARSDQGGSAEDVLDDREVFRQATLTDIRTLELVGGRAWHEAVFPADTEVAGVPVSNDTLDWAFATTTLTDPGTPNVVAQLWGRPLPFEQAALRSLSGAWSLPAIGGAESWEHGELLGTGAATLDAPLVETPQVDTTVVLHLAGDESVEGLRAWRYHASYAGENMSVEEDLWLADGFIGPLKGFAVAQTPGGTFTTAVTLVGYARGTGTIPWGQGDDVGDGTATPALAPLGPWGPEAEAGLAYPLAEAIAAVRLDPSLQGFGAMQRRGQPVLVNAFYEVRPAARDLQRPLPEARWLLVFHDLSTTEQEGEVAVETKRPLGVALPVAVNREQQQPYHALKVVTAVAAAEVPPMGPSIAGALGAWAERGDGRAPNVLVYGLARGERGLQPYLWAGASERDFAPSSPAGLSRSHALAMVLLDSAGWTRAMVTSTTRTDAQLAPLVAPRGDAPGPPVQPSSLDLAPLAAAGLGVAVVGGVLAKLGGFLYTRLDRPRLLAHPVRRALLDLVARRPGLHLEAAQQELGLGAGSLRHHLGMLQRAGLLTVQRSGRFQRLYLPSVPRAAAVADGVLRDPRSKALHELVQARPGLGLREAARTLGVPVSSLQWHVARLVDAGLVVRGPDGLRPAPRAEPVPTGPAPAAAAFKQST